MHLTGAGLPEKNISINSQTLVEDIACDILAEAGRGGYNFMAFGRRGSSTIKEFNLVSRASKMLHHLFDCTLIRVR